MSDLYSSNRGCLNRLKTSHIQLIKSVPNDLREGKIYQLLAIAVFGLVMIIFSFIDFNALIQPDLGLSIYTWDNDKAADIELWKRVFMLLSGLASFTGALTVVLTTFGKYSAFFWGILNCIFYGLFAFAYGYSGDAQLNILFFLPFQWFGILSWEHNLDQENRAISKALNITKWIAVIIGTFILGVIFYWEIPAFSRALVGYYIFDMDNQDLFSVPRLFDASTNAMSIVAQFLLIFRYREQWIFWIIIDVIQIAMFAGIAGFGVSFNIIVMWSLFLINAIFGCYQWWTRSLQPTDDQDLSSENSNYVKSDWSDSFDSVDSLSSNNDTVDSLV